MICVDKGRSILKIIYIIYAFWNKFIYFNTDTALHHTTTNLEESIQIGQGAWYKRSMHVDTIYKHSTDIPTHDLSYKPWT